MKPEVTWETLDWEALDRLRGTFLDGKPGGGSYWESASDLSNYDFTFAQRIGWKWDAVLRELRERGWTPPAEEVLDWGCGSGVAGRRVVRCYGAKAFKALRVFDQSPLAVEFATRAAREAFPGLNVESVETQSITQDRPTGIVVVSHVLNELTEHAAEALRLLLRRATAIIWVEAGTREVSRSLISWREALRDKFDIIAPCTHQAPCGMLAPENGGHWCHHFAAPPAGIMGDSGWVRFAQRAGIDLRSLPYSFLVMERKGIRRKIPGVTPEGCSRLIGAPRLYKGYAKVLSCQAEGVRELRLQKRAAPELFRAMKSGDAGSIHRWRIKEDDIHPDTSAG